MKRKKLARVLRTSVQMGKRSTYYSSSFRLNIRVYRPYLGEGLPKRGIWRREGRHVYFRCSGCSRINRDTVAMFATKNNHLVGPASRKLRTKDIGVLYRCIRCRHCGTTFSGIVLLGFKKPEAFLKKA